MYYIILYYIGEAVAAFARDRRRSIHMCIHMIRRLRSGRARLECRGRLRRELGIHHRGVQWEWGSVL